MSTQLAEENRHGTGFPELTVLGKRLELLRIGQGLSKQALARLAGTSRQQLWRVMTGKSELTTALCHRLAEVLQVDARALRDPTYPLDGIMSAGQSPGRVPTAEVIVAADLARYVADPAFVLRTLATLPADPAGQRLKRELLNCIEDVARGEGLRLAPSFFEIRGKVINGEL